MKRIKPLLKYFTKKELDELGISNALPILFLNQLPVFTEEEMKSTEDISM